MVVAGEEVVNALTDKSGACGSTSAAATAREIAAARADPVGVSGVSGVTCPAIGNAGPVAAGNCLANAEGSITDEANPAAGCAAWLVRNATGIAAGTSLRKAAPPPAAVCRTVPQ